jgi:alpha-L-rhamnosidase
MIKSYRLPFTVYLTTLFVMAGINSFAQQAVSVSNLRCEYLKDPLGIDVTSPRFSWELSSDEANKKQKSYRILVSTNPALLEKDQADAWDSKKTNSNLTNQIYYNGSGLKTNTLYFWKVRIWDEKGKASEWSPVARFFVGPLSESDWKAQWIGEKEEPIAPEDQYYTSAGYRSVQENQPDVKKWVVIDLGESKAFEEIKIYPMSRREKAFPLRFTVETASDADFKEATVIADESGHDNFIPSAEFYYKKLSAPAKGRYIRLNIIKLASVDKDKYEFGIAEIEILNNKENLALNKSVSTSDNSTLNYKYESPVITDGHIKPSDRKNYVDNIPPSPLLRKEIQIKKNIKNAFYSTSALGVYEAYINGEKIDAQALAPEFTDYDSHLQFQTSEVTGLLKQGANVLGATLADGWYAGARWSYPNRGGYGYFRKFIGQLSVNYEDGTSEIIATDGTWKMCMESPLREASNFIGEVYDAAYEQKGWNKTGFDDSKWRTVTAYPNEKQNLCAQLNEPLAIINEIKPVSVHKIGHNKYIFDLGQNMVGWCRLTLPYNPGQPIRFRYGEWLYDDGSLYTDNLRDAKQIDLYRPADEAKIEYEPRFTYHGFRYVEIEGLTREPQLNNLLGKVVASSSPIVSDFSCSDKDVNKLWENIRWTLWGNLTSVPTDCPQRDEREGWMADAQIFSQTAIYNLDMAGFYTKWTRDIRDSQLEDGRFPDIAPHDGAWMGFFNAPGWADAGVIIPWRVYQNYNDKQILAQQYEAMKKFVDFNHKNNPDLIWRNVRANDYNDWLNGNWINAKDYPKEGGSIPNEVFATAYFAQSAEIVAQSAKLLGKTNDYKLYSDLAANIRKAFVKEFVSSDGKIKGDTQTGYAIALQFNLLPVELRTKAAAQMVEVIKRYDYRISTGIHGTIMLMNQLSEYGYSDIAYQLLLSRRFPSWFYSIDQGATTIWERWDGYVAGRGFQDAGMNSFNHVAIGAVGEWMYRHILGIQLDESQPGFQHFFIKPQPGKELTWAKGNYHGISGNIEVSWTKQGDTFNLDITVPANTTATVVLPNNKTVKVGSGKHQWELGIKN